MKKDNMEYYFIQLCFTRNRELLRKQNRKLYDALFDKYKMIYQNARDQDIDLMDINELFLTFNYFKEGH